jgi:hypothetical protein
MTVLLLDGDGGGLLDGDGDGGGLLDDGSFPLWTAWLQAI